VLPTTTLMCVNVSVTVSVVCECVLAHTLNVLIAISLASTLGIHTLHSLSCKSFVSANEVSVVVGSTRKALIHALMNSLNIFEGIHKLLTFSI